MKSNSETHIYTNNTVQFVYILFTKNISFKIEIKKYSRELQEHINYITSLSTHNTNFMNYEYSSSISFKI